MKAKRTQYKLSDREGNERRYYMAVDFTEAMDQYPAEDIYMPAGVDDNHCIDCGGESRGLCDDYGWAVRNL